MSAPSRPDQEHPSAALQPDGVRTFHARRGRVSAAQRDEVATLLTTCGIPSTSPFDLDVLFGGLPVALEIGFGMGEATQAMALADPTVGILAVDVHTAGVLRLLRSLERTGTSNVRVAHEDAVALVTSRVPTNSLAAVRAFFPDPWPKTRHHKRRLVRPAVIALLASRLRRGGVLHLATDVAAYGQVMLDVVASEPLLRNVYGGLAPRPEDRPTTRYEQLGLELGHPVLDIISRRR